MEHKIETDRYEGIDPIIAYHLRNIMMSLSSLATDTDILEINGVGGILTQVESGVLAAIRILREQKVEKGRLGG